MSATDGKYARNKRGDLQRMLGDLGTVLPRVEHGSLERPAQGWYAKINGDGEVFLGDYSIIAGVKIEQLKSEHA